MNWILVLIFFVLGASVGSFVNVLIERSIQGRDWVRGRSRCDYCQKTLRWFDTIPLFSFLVYRGKTRCCHKNLSWKYPIVELLFGFLFVWWLLMGFVFFRLASSPWTVIQPGFWLVSAILLLIIGLGDMYYGMILMPVIYLGIGLLYCYRLGVYTKFDYLGMLIAGLLSGGFLLAIRILTKGKGMGDGDPYLAFWTGSILGLSRAFEGMLFAFVIGAIVGIFLIIFKQKSLKERIAFGPFLILGLVVGLVTNYYGWQL